MLPPPQKFQEHPRKRGMDIFRHWNSMPACFLRNYLHALTNLLHCMTLTYCLCFAGMRAEEFVYQKLDKPKPPRLTESESLGQSMIEAGNDFGPGTNYG